MTDIFRFRTIELRDADGQLIESLAFAHPWAAEVYLHLIPQMQVDGNPEVLGVASARLAWTDLRMPGWMPEERH